MAEDFKQAAIYFCEELAGVIGILHIFLDTTADDGGHESGANSVAHHITDKCTHLGVWDRKDVIEIPAEGGSGGVAMGEAEVAVLGRNADRKGQLRDG